MPTSSRHSPGGAARSRSLYADDLRVDLGVWDPIGDDDWEFNESVLYACIGVMNGQDEYVWLDEQLLRWTDYSASANEKLFDAAMQYVCSDLNYQRHNEWDFHVPASFSAAPTTTVAAPTTTVPAPTTTAAAPDDDGRRPDSGGTRHVYRWRALAIDDTRSRTPSEKCGICSRPRAPCSHVLLSTGLCSATKTGRQSDSYFCARGDPSSARTVTYRQDVAPSSGNTPATWLDACAIGLH